MPTQGRKIVVKELHSGVDQGVRYWDEVDGDEVFTYREDTHEMFWAGSKTPDVPFAFPLSVKEANVMIVQMGWRLTGTEGV